MVGGSTSKTTTYVPGSNMTTTTITTPTTQSTTTTVAPEAPDPGGCCGDKTITDNRCNNPGSDPNGGLGCNACGIRNCRFCGFAQFSPIKC